jgi:SAM-dependent methyltransferase
MENIKNNIQKTLHTITRKTQKYVIKHSNINRFTPSQLLLLSLSVIMSFFVLRHLIYYSIKVQSLDMMEGFENNSKTTDSNKKYVLKKNNELFDDFYVKVYDSLVYNNVKNSFELGKINENSVIDAHSKILDVGCGTGHHIGELLGTNEALKGENVVGIDNSQAMVNKAREYYPEYKSSFQKIDAMNGSAFRDNTFSHILCLYFTIYYIKDKYRFFKNCHNWLHVGGKLFVHIVEPSKFDPIVPAGNPLEIINIQNYADKRITTSKVIFNGFEYQANFNHKPDKNIASFTEKFMFKDGKTRENEHTLYMEEKDVIIDQAKQAGFIVKGKIHMHKCGYENQYLYILEKS